MSWESFKSQNLIKDPCGYPTYEFFRHPDADVEDIISLENERVIAGTTYITLGIMQINDSYNKNILQTSFPEPLAIAFVQSWLKSEY